MALLYDTYAYGMIGKKVVEHVIYLVEIHKMHNYFKRKTRGLGREEEMHFVLLFRVVFICNTEYNTSACRFFWSRKSIF